MYSTTIILITSLLSLALADPCNPNPCQVRQTCIAEPKQCLTQPCPQYRCETEPPAPADPCNPNPCQVRQTCTPEPKQCITQPCPQYRCDTAPPAPADPCATNPCAPGQTCQGTPKQCITQPCPQYTCQGTPSSSTCYTCKTAGVKSYYDGCNQCTCQADGTAACTELACIAQFPDPKKCAGHCDGFVTTDDGTCGTCTCVGGQKTKCSKCAVGTGCRTAQDGTSSCVDVGLTPDPRPAMPCDAKPCAAGEICVNEPKQCITQPCPQFRCDKPVVVAKPCDAKPCAAGETCVNEPKQCLTQPCPQFRCDKPVIVAKPCDAKPCAADETCVNEPKQCLTQPCPQYRCDAAPSSNTCFNCKTQGVKSFFDGCNQCSCQADGTAVCTKRACIALNPDPKQCANQCDGFVTADDGACGRCTCVGGQKTKCTKCGVGAGCKTAADGTPSCVAVVPPQPKACTENSCGANEICIEEPKQCITTPCPQFKCVADSNGLPIPPTTTGKCFNCKTQGVKSYYDGCNQCTCQADGSAACTALACIELLPSPKECANQCDGFLTEDDGACGRCTCIGGQKTKCSNCGVGSGCKTNAADGTSKCEAVVPPQTTCTENAQVPKGDACNTCKCVGGVPQQCTSRRCSSACAGVTKCAESGKICVAQRKQCITTPCDQYACVAIDSVEARNDAMLATMDDITDGAAHVSAIAAIVMTIVAMMF